jgi:hypothetical protein
VDQTSWLLVLLFYPFFGTISGISRLPLSHSLLLGTCKQSVLKDELNNNKLREVWVHVDGIREHRHQQRFVFFQTFSWYLFEKWVLWSIYSGFQFQSFSVFILYQIYCVEVPFHIRILTSTGSSVIGLQGQLPGTIPTHRMTIGYTHSACGRNRYWQRSYYYKRVVEILRLMCSVKWWLTK